jgi:hypothetical protein
MLWPKVEVAGFLLTQVCRLMNCDDICEILPLILKIQSRKGKKKERKSCRKRKIRLERK